MYQIRQRGFPEPFFEVRDPVTEKITIIKGEQYEQMVEEFLNALDVDDPEVQEIIKCFVEEANDVPKTVSS